MAQSHSQMSFSGLCKTHSGNDPETGLRHESKQKRGELPLAFSLFAMLLFVKGKDRCFISASFQRLLNKDH